MIKNNAFMPFDFPTPVKSKSLYVAEFKPYDSVLPMTEEFRLRDVFTSQNLEE